MPGSVVTKRTSTVLSDRFGMSKENTLYGQSICPDEINNEKGDLSYLMIDYWGECFPMGGIGGAPFVGRTGFGAFSAHVPENGNVLILFGPHIAISENGELGKYLRKGQGKESTACGAVLAAYDACKSGKVRPDDELDPYDMQQSWLKKKIQEQLDVINKAEEPISQLARTAYDVVEERFWPL